MYFVSVCCIRVQVCWCVGGVINFNRRKESFYACLFVQTKVAGRWLHANVHVLYALACAVDADKGERWEKWKGSNETLLNRPNITYSILIHIHLNMPCNTVFFQSSSPDNPISLIHSSSFLSSCAFIPALSHFIRLWQLWNCNQYTDCIQLRVSNHLYLLDRGFKQHGRRRLCGRMSVRASSFNVDSS